MTSYRSVSLLVVTLALGAGLAIVGGCGSDDGTPTGSTCPPGSTLTYANFGRAFMSINCSRCHAGKEEPTLTSQDQIKAHVSEIDKVAAAGPKATNTVMPEEGTVSVEDRKKLGEWLACGAP